MPTAHDATIANATPCPFCGGNDFTITQWTDDSAGDVGELDAIECNSCMAGAPTGMWNKRQKIETGK